MKLIQFGELFDDSYGVGLAVRWAKGYPPLIEVVFGKWIIWIDVFWWRSR